MSPSNTPSIWISPVVFRFPLIVKSDDKTEGAALGFGAEAFSISEFGFIAVFCSPDGGDGIVAEEVLVDSTGLDFENIFSTLL